MRSRVDKEFKGTAPAVGVRALIRARSLAQGS